MPLTGYLLLLFVVVFKSAYAGAETLVVGINNAGNPPLTFAENNPVKGIYHDILEQIGQLSGHRFKYVYLPPKRLLFAFDSGEIQLEPGINPNWRTTAKLPGVYTVPFATNENMVLFAKGKRILVRTPKDLLNRHVGTIRGYFYPGYMELFANGRIVRHDGDSEYNLMKRMASGRLEQIFIQKDVAFYWMSQKPEFAEFEVGNTNFKDPIMFRLHPSKRQLIDSFNIAIKILKENGRIEAIYAKYR